MVDTLAFLRLGMASRKYASFAVSVGVSLALHSFTSETLRHAKAGRAARKPGDRLFALVAKVLAMRG